MCIIGGNAGNYHCTYLVYIYGFHLRLARFEMGTAILLYAAIFHVLAGTVTGSLFKVRTLLLLLGLVFIELLSLVIVHGTVTFLWAIGLIVAIQVGYFVGMFARRALEHAGYSIPVVRERHIP